MHANMPAAKKAPSAGELCQEALLDRQDAVAAAMMQMAQWGLTSDAAPLGPSALALMRRKERGSDGTGVDKLFDAAKGGKGTLSVHELAVALTKAGPESRRWSSQSALHVAARSDFVEGVKLMLAHGFDIEAVDSRGLTPVRVAARHGAANAVAALIDAGARVEAQSSTLQRRGAVSMAISLSKSSMVGDTMDSAMAIALENVPKQPKCVDAAEVLAKKGCAVPPTLAVTALLLAAEHNLPALRNAASAAVEWRGTLPLVMHALENLETWGATELLGWLSQLTGRKPTDPSFAPHQDEAALRGVSHSLSCARFIFLILRNISDRARHALVIDYSA